MERKRTDPRDGWEQKIAEAGLIFDQAGGQPYWQEEAYYEFSAREVDDLEEATNTLHGLCMEAAAQVIEGDRLAELAIPAPVVAVIKESWRQERSFTLYGRFDFAYDGNSPPSSWNTTPIPRPCSSRPRGPVVSGSRKVPRRRPVQLHPRTADRPMEKAQMVSAALPLYFTYAEGAWKTWPPSTT